MKYGQHPKAFVNLLLAGLVGGILLADAMKLQPYQGAFFLGALLLLLAGAVLIKKEHKMAWACLWLGLILLGAGRYYLAINIEENNIIKLAGQQVKLQGKLAEPPNVTRDEKGKLNLQYVVEVEKVWQGSKSGKAGQVMQGKLLVYGGEESLKKSPQQGKNKATGLEDDTVVESIEDIYGQVGDGIQLVGTISEFHDYGNPGRMNTVMSNKAKGICGRAMISKYSLVIEPRQEKSLARLAEQVRKQYEAYMAQAMPKQDAAAIFAMLFGGYQGIRPELLEAFTVTGIVHILSVSGSHITLMAGTANIVGRFLHMSPRATAALATGVILFYSLLAGAIPPVIRSALMGILTLLALTAGRERDAQHILGLVALGLLLYSPLWLFDISFQLSFGATAGLLYLAPPLRESLRKKLPVFVADSLAVTIGAQLSVLPIIAWYFNVLSLSSLLANLVIAPIVEWIIVAGLLAGLLASLLPLAGKVVFLLASVVLGLVYELSRWVAALPGSQIYMPTFSWWGGMLYYMGLGWLVIGDEHRKRLMSCVGSKYLLAMGQKLRDSKGWQAFLLLGMLVVVFCCWQMGGNNKEMQVHFIDVGQGDSALVITPHGRAFMVDTGGVREGSYDIGSRVDVPYLLHYGVEKLDYIFLTHAHDDHAGGVKGILTKIPVGAIGIGHEGAGDYLQTFGTGEIGKIKKLLVPLQEGSSIELDGVRIDMLYSPESKKVQESQLQATGNEFSNLIRVSYGEASFLFTGDLIAEQEQQVLANGTNVASTVLKVGHHGSRTSSSQEFLTAVNPGWAVISCGYNNSFGHPHKEILNRLTSCTKAKILRTDQQGAIVFRSDGKSIKVESFY
mgnify:FL=1